MKRHHTITEQRVIRAVKEAMFGLEYPGFCGACGAERGGVEPDAEGYECYECGEHEVAGAEQYLF